MKMKKEDRIGGKEGMEKKEITVDQDLVNKIERRQFEYLSRQDILARLMEGHWDEEDVLNSKLFRAYEKQYLDAKIAYENAKAELERRYIQEQYDGRQIRWNLDFASCVVTIEGEAAGDEA